MASKLASWRFYVVEPRRGCPDDTEFFKADPIERGEAPRCARCGRNLGSRRWLPSRHAQIVFHGATAGDFAFASSSEFLVSDRVQQAVLEDGLTGITDFDEVEIVTLRAMDVVSPRYFHVDIARCGADIDIARSVIHRATAPDCTECLTDGVTGVHGFALDSATWSGADIFVPRGLPGVVVASMAFRSMVQKHHLSGLDLVPTELFKWGPTAG